VAERQIRELLGSAVADVTPRAADPVADVLRQYRRHRRRVGVAIGAIILLLAAGGFAAVPRFAGGGQRADVFASASPAESTVPVQTGPARPRVVGKEVVAGGLVMPVPPGWHTIDDGKTTYCNVPPRTIAVGFDPVPGGSGKYCGLKPFISVSGARLSAGLLGSLLRGANLRQTTLPGGQSAWMTTWPDTATATFGQRPYNVASLYLPWSGATVHVALDRTGYAEIFPTIRTRPVAPSTLALSASSAQIIGPNSLGRPVNSGPRITDPTVIAQALDRLGGLTAAASNDQACATLNMPTAVVWFNTITGPAAVVITLSDNCAQATSSLGGRVTVPRGFANELWRLLGGSGTVEPAK
jgi:hypothetical protein